MQDAHRSRGKMLKMLGRWWSSGSAERPAMSAEFDHVLMREVMRTELVRIKALIATTVLLLVVLWAVDLIAPAGLDHIWRGQFQPIYLSAILLPFILFELWVHGNIRRHLRLDRDVPVIRRYLGVLIETSLPTIGLAVHIQKMGPLEALGFVMPFAYFIFIILSTLRLDFWLSTFTGFVAAAELFYMAMFYHPVAPTDPAPDISYPCARRTSVLISGVLAGAVGVQLRRQFAASIAAATARDRVTNLFGQHVSPQVAERPLVESATTDSGIRPG